MNVLSSLEKTCITDFRFSKEGDFFYFYLEGYQIYLDFDGAHRDHLVFANAIGSSNFFEIYSALVGSIDQGFFKDYTSTFKLGALKKIFSGGQRDIIRKLFSRKNIKYFIGGEKE